MRNMKSNKSKGITLIALVITIIVLLILAGISLIALKGNNIIDEAKTAKNKAEERDNKEDKILSDYQNKMHDLRGNSTNEGTSSGDEKNETDGGNVDDNPKDSLFENVNKEETNPENAIPNGEITVIEPDAEKGIVIKDHNDNEWVWIEVPKTIFTTNNIEDTDTIKSNLITYTRDYKNSSSNLYDDIYYSECGLTSDNYTIEYNKMLKSIYTNGGFWLSRYEIGDNTATLKNSIRTSISGIGGKAVSQANQIPYTYVTCAQAQQVSMRMTPDENKTSSLLFGIQWDLVCKHLENKSGLTKGNINTFSTSWGNYCNKSLKLDRGKYNVNPGTQSNISGENEWVDFNVDTKNYVTSAQTSSNENYHQLLTTGASEQTNKMNIYDFAGNVWEWTLEKTNYTTTSSGSGYATIRGAYYGVRGDLFPASYRSEIGHNPTSSMWSIGFRTTLY